MDQSRSAQQKLIVTSIVEYKDEFEEKYEKGYIALQNLISGLSEKEAQNALNNAVCKDKAHDELSLGLLYSILTIPPSAAKTYRDLTLITRDGLSGALASLAHLAGDRYLRLTEVARAQLVWLARELVRNAVPGVDGLCFVLLRHAAGGDVSARNVLLVESLLDVFVENRLWLDKHPVMISMVVYTYLRLIEDHMSPMFAVLRQKEVAFVSTLVRERFPECLAIGRDFARLLQNVARIPEFDKLWRDILQRPKSLCPNFTGVLQILQTRTSRRFLHSRLTPDMEKKLAFLTANVRFGYHKRYQEWFQRQYLATPESQSLRCDLIRYIVGVIHPTNEQLGSDITPRWAVIGWLLTTCTSVAASANAKLALFYDFLFFDAEKDNIMNIEPAILVMYNSMRSHPSVTATLLDFLCRIIPNFCPPLADSVRAGIFTSLNQILEKRVLASLSPLFDSKTLDRDLRTNVREVFKQFCVPPSFEGKVDEFSPSSLPVASIKDDVIVMENHSMSTNHTSVMESEPTFSDDEEDRHVIVEDENPDEDDDDDIPLAKVRLKDKPVSDCEASVADQLEGELRKAVQELHLEKDNEARCQAMERLVQQVIQEEEMDTDLISTLGSCLCSVLEEQFDMPVFPTEPSDEAIEDSIGRPLFVMFRNVVQLPEDSRRMVLLNLLAEMMSHRPSIGYLLLYFLKACKLSEAKPSVYMDFCQSMDKKLDSCLLSDLELCNEDDTSLFCWLLPDVYAQFSQVAIGHVQLLHLVVSTVCPARLQNLVCYILQGRLVMFRPDSFRALLSASLRWETFEQYCLWQLVAAHGIPIDYVLPILPILQFDGHAEALTAILLMLKQERPTADLLKHLLSREVRPPNDIFVLSTLQHWCREHQEKLGELIAALLTSRYPNTFPNKRKRGSGGGQKVAANTGPPTAEQVLGHLDQLRQGCRQNQSHLYSLDSMQRALQQAQSSCSDAQRKRFSDLFALAEAEEVEAVVKKSPGRGGAGRKAKGKGRAAPKEASDSSDESSEEEEIVKPKHAKKRKKVILVGSDSD
ncbi:integrator complex subunit 3 isoform X2 [Bacillus rossius redtenbacheri]|uniref:integrator complex subunit 3 isoform X2 n=1 Tax=Bacillus rossius redtenbacheri TaxID=93214 RepID=UPI002FDD944E